jgi:hypothetical protein
MTPLYTLISALEAIASWLMSILDLLAILVAVVLCMLLTDFVLERAAFRRAYTVKTNSLDEPAHRRNGRWPELPHKL